MKFHFFSLLLFLVVALMSALLVNTVTAGGGSLTVNPATTSALVGFTAVVDLDISGLSNVQGADVAVSFDETILQVVDADGVASGVQISGGDCPTPDFEALNDADNGSGTIEYAAVSTSGTCGSGSVASVQFLCVDTGTSPVTITSSEISDNNGFLIPHTTVDGQVTCSEATAIIFLPLVKRD